MHFTHGPHRDHHQRTCKGCRHWSERIAENRGAMCLNKDSPQFMHYMSQQQSCPAWRIGHLGATDEPGGDGLEYARAAAIVMPLQPADVCSGCQHAEHVTGTGYTCTEGWPAAESAPESAAPMTSCIVFTPRKAQP